MLDNELVITVANTPAQISAIRQLLFEYGQARKFDAALGDYATELAKLPGKYIPPDGCLLLATYHDQPAGCIAYRKIDEGICEIKRMYVSPPFRGKSIGKKLINQLIEQARLANYRLIRLDSHPNMYIAQTMYQSFGFKAIDRYNDNPTPGIRFFELEL